MKYIFILFTLLQILSHANANSVEPPTLIIYAPSSAEYVKIRTDNGDVDAVANNDGFGTWKVEGFTNNELPCSSNVPCKIEVNGIEENEDCGLQSEPRDIDGQIEYWRAIDPVHQPIKLYDTDIDPYSVSNVIVVIFNSCSTDYPLRTNYSESYPYPNASYPLKIQGVMDLDTTGEDIRAIHLVVTNDISATDVTKYKIRSFDFENVTNAIEVSIDSTKLSAMDVGDDLLLVRYKQVEGTGTELMENDVHNYLLGNILLRTYCFTNLQIQFIDFGEFDLSDTIKLNGNDAVQLKYDDIVIDEFGVHNVEATYSTYFESDITYKTNYMDEIWGYKNSWRYRNGNSWDYGGTDCTEIGVPTNVGDSACIYPSCLPSSSSVSSSDSPSPSPSSSGPCEDTTAINVGSSSSCIYLNNLTCTEWKQGYKGSACCSARI